MKFAHINDLFVVPIAVVALLTIPAQPAPPASPTPSPSPSPSGTPVSCVYPVTAGMVINNAGKNYAVGDRLRAIGGISCIENFPFSLQVSAIDSNGGVTAVTIIGADSNGYLTAGSAPASPIAFAGSATGSGFKATCSFAPH
jgi:hypothetical protein